MFVLIWFILLLSILNSTLINAITERNVSQVVIIGGGAAGISAAAKLLENGFNNITILEAENRIGGRVNSVPLGKGYIDLGAQWCQGQAGNAVYELVHKDFEFGDTYFSHEKSHFYHSNGNLMDREKCCRLTDLSESIMVDYDNMKKSNKSFGEFIQSGYEEALRKKEFENVDQELADEIRDLMHKETNLCYASESWFDISAQLNAYADAEGSNQLTWKELGYKTVFDFLTKKRPDPSKALKIDEKIHFDKEVTNINWNNGAIVRCADGSEYQADHVIFTASLGVLKKHHSTLFTPQMPEKKLTAITNTGYGTLGKIFLEFEKPFWPADISDWVGYIFLWKQDDLAIVNGTEKEWIKDVMGFIRVDAQPNMISALVAGKNMKHFEELSDIQLIDDCMWLLEKFLNKSLPRPQNMQRSHWLTNKHFLGSYSFPSMDTQEHNVAVGKDLGESICNNDRIPVLLFAGEATHEKYSGYVHGAVASGWRAGNEIVDYYRMKR